MGFLEDQALNRARDRLRSVMKPGETILDFDIAALDSRPSVRVDLICTDRALYWTEPSAPSPIRLPYEWIGSVLWDPTNPVWRGRFIVTLTDGRSLSVTMKRGYRSLASIVKEKVDGLVVTKVQRTHPSGRTATFICRPLDEDSQPYWGVIWDGHDPVASKLKAWGVAEMDRLISETGLGRTPHSAQGVTHAGSVGGASASREPGDSAADTFFWLCPACMESRPSTQASCFVCGTPRPND